MLENQLKKPVKKGGLLLKEEPFIYILSSKYRTEYCDHCFARTKLKRCTGCQYVYYCGRVCQKDSWSTHKEECSSIKRVAPRVIPDAARVIARLIRKLNRGGDIIKSYYGDGNFRMFKHLMSHYSDLKENRRKMEHFTCIYGVLFEFLGESTIPNTAELMGIYGRICVNSFNICDSELTSLGTGVYLAASIMDHSCQPNAVATFEGTTLYIRALVDLPHSDWKDIRISYIDVMNTPIARQEELRSIYYFTCQCIKCIDLDIPLLPYMTGAACPNSTCDACIEIDTTATDAEGRLCNKCKTEVKDEFLAKFREIMDLSELHLKQMKDMNYFDVCKFCLERQKGVLHKFNLNYVKMLDSALSSAIDIEKLDFAEAIAYELIEPYKFYYDNHNPLLGLLYLKLGKLLVLHRSCKEGLKYLNLAFNILKITHGNTSKIFKCELLPLIYQAKTESEI